MNTKELLEKHIIHNGIYPDLTSNISYILDYGDIPLYENEEKTQELITELELKLNETNSILEKLNTIVHDNYDY